MYYVVDGLSNNVFVYNIYDNDYVLNKIIYLYACWQ